MELLVRPAGCFGLSCIYIARMSLIAESSPFNLLRHQSDFIQSLPHWQSCLSSSSLTLITCLRWGEFVLAPLCLHFGVFSFQYIFSIFLISYAFSQEENRNLGTNQMKNKVKSAPRWLLLSFPQHKAHRRLCDC